MRRGGKLLLIIIVLILVLSVVAFFVISGSGGLTNLLGGGQAAQPASTSKIVIAKQPLNLDELISAETLEVIPYPADKIGPTMFTDVKAVADIYYAKFPIGQGVPLTKDMLSLTPFGMPEGSQSAKSLPGGMVAIAIPATRLGLVGYAIRAGDHVDVIATNLFVDVDASFQSVLPNYTSVITAPSNIPPNPQVLTLGIASGGAGSVQGRTELDPTLNQAIYLSPAEAQRPRLVSQMILQNIQVLQVGDFTTGATATTDPNAAPADQQAQAAPAPDIVTLIVSPQDAISLTYLMYADAKITLVLRSEGDENPTDIQAVTLQFLLSQYNIPLPAKLPYALDPRVDKLPLLGVAPTPLPKQ